MLKEQPSVENASTHIRPCPKSDIMKADLCRVFQVRNHAWKATYIVKLIWATQLESLAYTWPTASQSPVFSSFSSLRSQRTREKVWERRWWWWGWVGRSQVGDKYSQWVWRVSQYWRYIVCVCMHTAILYVSLLLSLNIYNTEGLWIKYQDRWLELYRSQIQN